MRRMLLPLCALLLVAAAGCGNDADRGRNRDRDLPRLGDRPTEPAAEKKK